MSHYEVLQAGPEDHSAVLDFVAEHFVPHEPLNCSMNLLSPGYRIPFFDRWLESYLRQEDTVTMVGRHVETGEMLGVCVVEVERSSFKSYSPSPTDTGPSYSVCPEKLRKVFAFLDWLKLDLDIGKECEVKEWGDVILITCRSDLRTPGLGTELARRAVQAVRDRGVKVFTATATSHYSARIFEKIGFNVIRECKYEDYKVEGNVMFSPPPPHRSAKQFIAKKF